MQRALRESAQEAGVSAQEQETGIVDPQIIMTAPVFGPATRSTYDAQNWAMVPTAPTWNNETAIPPASKRKRPDDTPAFLVPGAGDLDGNRIGAFLTILHAIPLARNKLLESGEPASSYWHNAEWWQGKDILAPDVLSRLQAGDLDANAPEAFPNFEEEVHRIIAFLDQSTRSYCAASSLANLLPALGSSSESAEKNFYEIFASRNPEQIKPFYSTVVLEAVLDKDFSAQRNDSNVTSDQDDSNEQGGHNSSESNRQTSNENDNKDGAECNNENGHGHENGDENSDAKDGDINGDNEGPDDEEAIATFGLLETDISKDDLKYMTTLYEVLDHIMWSHVLTEGINEDAKMAMFKDLGEVTAFKLKGDLLTDGLTIPEKLYPERWIQARKPEARKIQAEWFRTKTALQKLEEAMIELENFADPTTGASRSKEDYLAKQRRHWETYSSFLENRARFRAMEDSAYDVNKYPDYKSAPCNLGEDQEQHDECQRMLKSIERSSEALRQSKQSK